MDERDRQRWNEQQREQGLAARMARTMEHLQNSAEVFRTLANIIEDGLADDVQALDSDTLSDEERAVVASVVEREHASAALCRGLADDMLVLRQLYRQMSSDTSAAGLRPLVLPAADLHSKISGGIGELLDTAERRLSREKAQEMHNDLVWHQSVAVGLRASASR